MTKLLELFTYFLMLSIAVERAVEIIKISFLKRLSVPSYLYSILAVTFGSAMSYLSPPPDNIANMTPFISAIATGLAVSGGSSFWNTVIDRFATSTRKLKE